LQRLTAKISGYFTLIRPLNVLQGAVSAIITAFIMEKLPPFRDILLAIFIIGAFTAAGNSFNDYCDYKIDAINRPKRPIPSGKISRKEALVLTVVFFTLGWAVAMPLMSQTILIILTIATICLITYSLFLKSTALVGNMIVALILGLSFIFSAAVYGDIKRGFAPFTLAFLFTLIREIIKDMQDIKGDEKHGAKTFPIAFGQIKAARLVSFLSVLLIVIAVALFLTGVYGFLYGIVVGITVVPVLIFTIISINRDQSIKNCGKLSSLLKYDIFFGLLAICLGRF